MLDRLKENEVVIGVIGALFCALFVGGLMAWALVRVLREAANGLLGQKKLLETKRLSRVPQCFDPAQSWRVSIRGGAGEDLAQSGN